MDQRELSLRQIMNPIYKDICGFHIPRPEEALIRKCKGSPVYGEINHQSLTNLITYLKLTKNDVFYDLGSGVGKVVLHTALCAPVKKAVGIELSKTRHHDALQALANAKSLINKPIEKCSFINADLMTVDLSNATVIYTCSTAFSLGFMKSVVQYLSTLPQEFRLVTLQDLPHNGPFKLIDKLKLDMSWARKTPVHIYKRDSGFVA